MDLGRSNFLAEVYEISTMNKYINYVIQNLKRWMKPEETDLDMMIGPGKSYII